MTSYIKKTVRFVHSINHYIIHFMLGILWFFFLREIREDIHSQYLILSLLGSITPDIEHIAYIFLHGKHDEYSKKVRDYMKKREWNSIIYFLKNNHKYLTALRFHSLQWMAVLFIFSLIAYQADFVSSLVLFGSMIIHYAYDMVDDMVILGRLNPNWKRGFIRMKVVTKSNP